ncbi:MAG: hypothetical protein IJS53_01235, partial [Clostridia bacterium]|nr:hypothetical protein [Clostridia bacterium]
MLERLQNADMLDVLCAEVAATGAAAYEVCDGFKPALAAALAERTGRQVLYIAPGDREASRVAEDAQQYLSGRAGCLRMRERQFVHTAASHESEWQRLTVLEGALKGETRLLCAAADALLWRMTPPQTVEEMTLSLKVGGVIAPSDLVARLIDAGYERVDMVEGRGQCALRGHIVDVYPPTEADALRVEFYDDTIDGIRAFDCLTQRSLRHLREACVTPAGEYLLRREDRPRAGAAMRALLEKARQRAHAARPQSKLAAPEEESGEFDEGSAGLRRLLREAERLEEGGVCRVLDLWAGLLMPETCGLLAYLDRPIVIVDAPDRCRARMDDIYASYQTDLALAVEHLEAVPEQQDLLLTAEEALEAVNAQDLLTLQDFLRGGAGFRQGRPWKAEALPAPQYHGSVRDAAADLNAWTKEGGEIYLLSGG